MNDVSLLTLVVLLLLFVVMVSVTSRVGGGRGYGSILDLICRCFGLVLGAISTFALAPEETAENPG